MLYDVIYHPFPINFQYVGVDSPAHRNFDWGTTSFQTSNFSCAEPNA